MQKNDELNEIVQKMSVMLSLGRNIISNEHFYGLSVQKVDRKYAPIALASSKHSVVRIKPN